VLIVSALIFLYFIFASLIFAVLIEKSLIFSVFHYNSPYTTTTLKILRLLHWSVARICR
jgi:hypothetical protein